MSISIALIARDEVATLGRCLGSIRDAVDEIVVVDTGSTDSTKAVARRFTDRVFDYAWHDDFAAARQFAFDRATGDWVGWLDADDVVVGAHNIRRMVADARPEVGAFHWRYVVDRDVWGNSRCEFWRERLVRNDGTFRWHGRVHEVLAPQRPWATLRAPDVVVEHRPLPGRSETRGRRNLAILEAEYDELGNESPARLLYYLAREYADIGDNGRAITFFRKYLRLSNWDDERYLAHIRLADLYRREGRFNQAINTCLLAVKICPHWPDAYFGLAATYYFLRDWHKVIHWCEVGRAMPRPGTPQIVNPLDYSFNWIIYYTNALFHLGEVAEGLAWTRRALEICPDDRWHRENLRAYGGQREADTARDEPGFAAALTDRSPIPRRVEALHD